MSDDIRCPECDAPIAVEATPGSVPGTIVVTCTHPAPQCWRWDAESLKDELLDALINGPWDEDG